MLHAEISIKRVELLDHSSAEVHFLLLFLFLKLFVLVGYTSAECFSIHCTQMGYNFSFLWSEVHFCWPQFCYLALITLAECFVTWLMVSFWFFYAKLVRKDACLLIRSMKTCYAFDQFVFVSPQEKK